MKCPQCPYYEQKTSYGAELVKCSNEECEEVEEVEKARMKNERGRRNFQRMV